MQNKLPMRLNADPIIDAVIEIRVDAHESLSDVMPGVLMGKLGEDYKGIQKLPASNLPQELREHDPQLQYQPLIRVLVGSGFSLLVGDKLLAVVCSQPYPGGVKFKQKALQLINIMLELPIVTKVSRLSIKYTDFIEAQSLSELSELLNLHIQIGENFHNTLGCYNLNFQIVDDELYHWITLAALTKLNNDKDGMMLQVDSIKNINKLDVEEFKNAIDGLLDHLHSRSKEQFFSLLTDTALNKLEAVYE